MTRWTEPQVADEKRRIKEELDALREREGPAACLDFILGRITGLADAPGSEDQLRWFIYIVSAFVHHERHGGLSPSQVKQLAGLAHAILETNGVRAVTSRLCFLYGELHLVLSQIRRREGLTWMAAWEQQLASRLARRAPPGGKGFMALAFGLRALRLGDAGVAYRQFEMAEGSDISAASKDKARVLRVYALRMAGHGETAKNLAEEVEKQLDPASSEALLDLQWQRLCLAASATGDLGPLLEGVRKDGPFWTASYVLEAYLWALAAQSTQWLAKLPKFATLLRRKELDVMGHATKFQATCVRSFLDCYDDGFSFSNRLRLLGETLCELRQHLTVDKELLAWMAATRWLIRNNYYEMAALTFGEYGALSKRLSDGTTGDVLSFAGDIVDKPWLLDLKRVG